MSRDRPLTIAIVALGGQGGGVLTGWLVELALARGWLAQSTYVAGVAQRTGATVYCVEMFPDLDNEADNEAGTDADSRLPVFALYPVPGDVDIVIASELAEAGRAVQKGFVTPNITTLLASSHRVYSITEKSALGDGRARSEDLLRGLEKAARELICFDMSEAAAATGSVINAVLLGALAGSGKLPFEREDFEAVIRQSGKAVENNLAGFELGFEQARQATAPAVPREPVQAPEITGPNGRALAQRIHDHFPPEVATVALYGALRALDYQDRKYADDYVDRLIRLFSLDCNAGGSGRGFELTRVLAAQLALQLCYEDTIRVADLKTRPQRLEQIRRDLAATDDQPAYVMEYFHPRFEEFCDVMPAWLGRRLLQSERARRLTRPIFSGGRNLTTNKLGGFVLLSSLAAVRRWRRQTLRYAIQQRLVDDWLTLVREAVAEDYGYAVWLARSIEMVRGYGETYERGLARYRAAVAASGRRSAEAREQTLRSLLEAAMADEEGQAFEKTLGQLAGTTA